ncbi:MAG: flavodoxin family protein [Desulfobaccales bacterium]
MLLVINGSPKPHGNLSRLLEKIAEATGADYEIIHLAKLQIHPCLGCVKCADTNRCIQPDDMGPLYDKILAADALIVGPVVYFGKANAFTHTFLERLFPLRHLKLLTKGKIAAVVAVGSNGAERCVNEVVSQLENYFDYKIVGSVFFNSATPPCFSCGYGTTCPYGAPARYMMTPEEFKNFTEITPEMFQRFEDHPEITAACEQLSRDLAQAISR